MNIIYNEDCLTGMKRIPDHSVDLVIADPPYGVTNLAYDTKIDMIEFFSETQRVAKERAAILLFGVEPFLSGIRVLNADIYRYDWIWKKTISTGFLNAHKMPLRSYEVISVFYRKLPIYNPQMTKSDFFSHRVRRSSGNANHYHTYAKDDYEYHESDERFPNAIIEIANPHGNCLPKCDRYIKAHPSMKPVELCRYLIRTYSMPGQIVLDPFMGGGQCRNGRTGRRTGLLWI